VWDPRTYLRYADERSRPFHDLMARVAAEAPTTVVDLGCGPGTLTVILAERWPSARVLGIDSSPEMIASAGELRTPSVQFEVGDLRSWRPDAPVDVLVSNATLQWVPGHLELLPSLLSGVAPGGWFAFQVPGNFDEPSHTLLRALASSPRWRDRLGTDVLAWPDSHPAAAYLDVLARLGCRVEAWETTYLHLLRGEDAVLDWVSGTALRPVLAALDDPDRTEFVSTYGAALREAYPQRPYGAVLPYRRIFAVAHKAEPYTSGEAGASKEPA